MSISNERTLGTSRCAVAGPWVVWGPFLLWAVWQAAGGTTAGGPPAPASEPRREPAPAADRRPVILLTGFEPFGPGRPANPSWEGIAPLTDQPWRGFRLVSKQLPVLWGAPLRHLQQWIREYQPVAIFSFGQGGAGSFTVESRAANQRGGGHDNAGATPPTSTIAADGPEQVQASINCEGLARRLSKKGYPIRVSTHAGRYLCEENLYTLEYLKQKNAVPTVSFCHVPPLGVRLGEQRVTVEYVRQFVQDVLEAWYAIDHAPAAGDQGAPGPQAPPSDPRAADVQELIRRYFRTWSAQDMQGYGACFLDGACVQFLTADGQLRLSQLPEFLAGQRQAHRMALHRQTEVPETIDIRFEGELARVVVYWKLTAGPKLEYGYDHFTIVKSRGIWRIANLLFYVTKSTE